MPYADDEMQSGRQHAEGDGAVEPLAAQLLGDERLAEQDPLEPVAPTSRGRTSRSWRARSARARMRGRRLLDRPLDTQSILSHGLLAYGVARGPTDVVAPHAPRVV